MFTIYTTSNALFNGDKNSKIGIILRYMFYEFFWETGKFTASYNSAMNLIPKTCRDEGAYAKDVAYNAKGSEKRIFDKAFTRLL